MGKECVEKGCTPAVSKPELADEIIECVFPPGVYTNMDVEIGADCKIKRLEPSEETIETLCDKCLSN